jgi:hypothetical protein
MATLKDNSKPTALQDNVTAILPERFDYDVDAIDDFLSLVFHSELAHDENILTWITRGIPAFPITDEKLLSRLAGSTRPSALYFGTSTTVLATDDDIPLRNKKELFKRFHVLVLDDIGSKVPVSKIPADFLPTYIIETSAGNFQYGYVLEEPLTELAEASALVQLVYEAGYSDGGGMMATKLVRLPDGVNGKRGDPVKAGFHVKLISSDGPRWHPADILDALDIGVNWEDVVKDADAVRKQRAALGVGTSAWSPIALQAQNSDGIVDPVAEWLYEQGMVKQETNDFLTVTCPWADTHTSGGDWGSYSPMGRGEAPYTNKRIYNCFHEHCKNRKGQDFLEYVAARNGPEAAVREDAPHLVSTYAFDPILNGVWDIKSFKQPTFIPLAGWKNLHTDKAAVVSVDGSTGIVKTKHVPETTLYMQSKARVAVSGMTYDPTNPAKIVEDSLGNKYVNSYTQPSWGDGDYNPKDVDTFIQFLTYLIPDDKDREHYIDWLAAKAQSMAFRGTAILMIAESQGTGRTTLGNMLGRLFGPENTEKVKFKTLAEGGGNFNEWLCSPFIITDETFATGDQQNFYKVYENIKELIDTSPETIRINPKYGQQRSQTTYSSFMLFSNHRNAMAVAEGDRRIYVIHNASQPAKPEYFVKLHEWLNKDNGAWARAVWRWLRQRKVNVADLIKPPEMNAAKRDMIDAGKNAPEIAIDAVLAHWPTKLVASYQIKEVLEPFKRGMHMREYSSEHKKDTVLQHRINGKTRKLRLEGVDKMKLVGRVVRPIAITSRLTKEDIWMTARPLSMAEVRENIVDDELTPEFKAEIAKAVEDALSEADF